MTLLTPGSVETVGSLLLLFFRFYSLFPYDNYVISIRKGTWVTKAQRDEERVLLEQGWKTGRR